MNSFSPLTSTWEIFWLKLSFSQKSPWKKNVAVRDFAIKAKRQNSIQGYVFDHAKNLCTWCEIADIITSYLAIGF